MAASPPSRSGPERRRSARPPHGRGWRAFAAATAVAVSTLAPSLMVADPVAARPARTAQDAPTPEIRVTEQDLEVEPDGDFKVVLDIAGAPPGSVLTADIYDRITHRSELAASATRNPGVAMATFEPFPLADPVATDQDAFFVIALAAESGPRRPGYPGNWSFRLSEPGVYPLRIRLRDQDRADVASIVTYLVRRPDPGDPSQTVEPTDLGLVTTVATTPPAAPSDTEALGGEFLSAIDATVATLASAPTVPVDLNISPDTAVRMAEDPDAVDTLAALRTEVDGADRELMGSPYVDIDAAGLVSAGLTDEVVRQRDYGALRLAQSLALERPRGPGGDIWMIDEPIDGPTVEALGQAGVTRLVVQSRSDADTPAGPVSLGSSGAVTAISASPASLGDGRPTDPILAAYQLVGRLAATATIDRGGALALSIDPAKVDQEELATVLAQLARPSAFITPTALSTAFEQPPRPDGAQQVLGPVEASPQSYTDALRDTRQLLASYGSLFPDRPLLLDPFERPLVRSASIDLDLSARLSRIAEQRTALEAGFGAITAPARDQVTLGTRDARFPLPITSTSKEPATVLVTLDAPDRLSLPSEPIRVTLAEGRTIVPIPVRTRATGDTPLRITIRTPDGSRVIAQSLYTVRSTAVSGVGLLLTVGAGGFLALWWGRHWYRTRRGARHARSGAGHGVEDLDDEAVLVGGGS